MFKGFSLFILILVFVLGLFLGGGVVSSCGPKTTIAVGKETTTVIVVVHDTVNTAKTIAQVVVSKRLDTIYVTKDAVTTIMQKDTAVCYSIDEKEKDGAYIKADMCSNAFPVNKPPDLKGNIFYISAPETSKTIHLTNTVVQTKLQPIFGDWRFWTGCVVMLIAGAYAGHSLK
jgi:hypothetical protein